jgi:hypothetical protein
LQDGKLVLAGGSVAPDLPSEMDVSWMAVVFAGEAGPNREGKQAASNRPKHRRIRRDIFTMRDFTMLDSITRRYSIECLYLHYSKYREKFENVNRDWIVLSAARI